MSEERDVGKGSSLAHQQIRETQRGSLFIPVAVSLKRRWEDTGDIVGEPDGEVHGQVPGLDYPTGSSVSRRIGVPVMSYLHFTGIS